jgi:hypothetical protein
MIFHNFLIKKVYKDIVQNPKRGFAKDKNFKCLSFKKVKRKSSISSPD